MNSRTVVLVVCLVLWVISGGLMIGFIMYDVQSTYQTIASRSFDVLSIILIGLIAYFRYTDYKGKKKNKDRDQK